MSNYIHSDNPSQIIISAEEQLKIYQERIEVDMKFIQARIKLKNIWELLVTPKKGILVNLVQCQIGLKKM